MSSNLLNNELRTRLHEDFVRFRGEHPELETKLFVPLDNDSVTDDERSSLEFIYYNLPYSDLANKDHTFFLNLVRKTLEVRTRTSWSSEITDERFLLYVLYPRSSSEGLDGHREIFAEELLPMVEGMDLTEATLTINYWSFSKATYASTDRRTAGPLTVVKRTIGRCGEESAFTVAALRSVGIPARAVFTPRWAHSDDNHAWVEAWTGDGWHYLGACEPEPVLDKGWFTGPAARGALILTNHVGQLEMPDEPTLKQSYRPGLVNLSSRYSNTALLQARVTKDGEPLEGVRVAFHVVNYASISELIALKTDSDGQVSIHLGRGEYIVSASKDDGYMEKKASIAEGDTAVMIELGTKPFEHPEVTAFESAEDAPYLGTVSDTLLAPPAVTIEWPSITDEVMAHHEERVEKAQKLRAATKDAFVQPDNAELAGEKDMGDIKPENLSEKSLTDMLAAAMGNSGEIQHFMDRTDLPAELGEEARLRLLRTLRYKDYSDVTSDQLADHLTEAWQYSESVPAEIFDAAVLSPRLDWEFPSAWRSPVAAHWSEEEKTAFREDPVSISQWVDDNIKAVDDEDSPLGYAYPHATLELKAGNESSRNILFIAIARSLGIPARLSPLNRARQVWVAGDWIDVNPKTADDETAATESATLRLRQMNEDDALGYGSQWTLASWSGERWQTLGFYGRTFPEDDATLDLTLPAGTYRLVLSVRSDRGDVSWKTQTFSLAPGADETVPVVLPSLSVLPQEEIRLGDLKFEALDQVAQHEAAADLAARTDFDPAAYSRDQSVALLVMEPGREPTEHLLNELLARRYSIETMQDRFLVAFTEEANLEQQTLRRVLNSFKELPLAGMRLDDVHAAMDELKLTREMPLVVVLGTDNMVHLSIAGYQVGTVDQVLRTLEKEG